MYDAEDQQNNSQEDAVVEKNSMPENIAIYKARNMRIGEIKTELKSFGVLGGIQEDIEQQRMHQEEEYEKKIAGMEGLNINNVTKEMIYKKMVDDVIVSAQAENERFDSLKKEKENLFLYNNLELDENAEEQIKKAREAIIKDDETGEKLAIFDQALKYYAKEGEKIAEVPIYHGTGSHSFYKILENGGLDSSKNSLGGEKDITGVTHGGTSFAISGYEQTEIVSHLYATMNEKTPRLLIDRKNILENYTSPGRELVDALNSELPKLNPEEKKFAEEELNKSNIKNIINLFDNEKYYFDYDKLLDEMQESKDKIQGKRGEITNKSYSDYLKARISYLENKIKWYNDNTSDEEKELLKDPFSVVLIYDGSDLPKEDLETFTTGGICERRTNHKIDNSKIKQIRAPYIELDNIKEWINKKIQSLPLGSEERRSLENVEIIPLEYFESKKIIQGQKY